MSLGNLSVLLFTLCHTFNCHQEKQIRGLVAWVPCWHQINFKIPHIQTVKTTVGVAVYALILRFICTFSQQHSDSNILLKVQRDVSLLFTRSLIFITEDTEGKVHENENQAIIYWKVGCTEPFWSFTAFSETTLSRWWYSDVLQISRQTPKPSFALFKLCFWSPPPVSAKNKTKKKHCSLH